MIRKSFACRHVMTSSSIFKLKMLRRVIIGDETLIFLYNPEIKCLSSQWKPSTSPRPKQVKSQSHVDQILRCVGVIHSEFLPLDQTINQQIYKEIMWCIFRPEHEKRRELLQDKSWQRQCTCSQRPEHPAVPDGEEHRRTGTTSLFTWSYSMKLFPFLQAQEDHQVGPFWRRGDHQESRNDGAEIS